MRMTQDAAEAYSLQVLAWLLEDNARITGFLTWSGMPAPNLRARIGDPALLLAVLDYLMLDEPLLLDACAALGVPPDTPLNAHMALPGGNEPHWT